MSELQCLTGDYNGVILGLYRDNGKEHGYDDYS